MTDNRCLKKVVVFFLDLPIKLALKLRDDLKLFNSEKYGSVWVDCQSSFNVGSKKKMLITLFYNPNRTNFFEFLEQLTEHW